MDVKTVASKVVGQMANSAVPFSGPVAESLVQELLGAQDEQILMLRRLSDDLNRLLDGPRFTSLDMVWFRFFNPKQVEHPDYPPLPPRVVLEDVGELVNDLMRLAMMGILP